MNHDDIPPEFYSFETNAPFKQCIECEKFLLDDETEYMIEKAVKTYDGYTAKNVIFDYAVCMDCAEDMRKDISKESWTRMMQYFQHQMDNGKRTRMLSMSVEECLKQCLVKKTNIDDCREYQVYAHCKGRKLDMSSPPFMLSGDVMDELLPLLSNKTVNGMNGFFKRHFSPDPALFAPTPPMILV